MQLQSVTVVKLMCFKAPSSFCAVKVAFVQFRCLRRSLPRQEDRKQRARQHTRAWNSHLESSECLHGMTHIRESQLILLERQFMIRNSECLPVKDLRQCSYATFSQKYLTYQTHDSFLKLNKHSFFSWNCHNMPPYSTCKTTKKHFQFFKEYHVAYVQNNMVVFLRECVNVMLHSSQTL